MFCPADGVSRSPPCLRSAWASLRPR